MGGPDPAHQFEQLQKALQHVTVRTSGRPAELTETSDLHARSVETAVAVEVDQCLADELAEHLRRILRKALQAA